MSKSKIAVSDSRPNRLTTQRECIYTNENCNADVVAIVLQLDDIICGKLGEIDTTGYGTPVSIAAENQEHVPAEYLPHISGVLEDCEPRQEFYGCQLETAASHYETQLRLPFLHVLVDYINQSNSAFDCPGHQGGESLRHHPVRDQFIEYLGEVLFRTDLCNAGVAMGDLLIYEGAPCIAQ